MSKTARTFAVCNIRTEISSQYFADYVDPEMSRGVRLRKIVCKFHSLLILQTAATNKRRTLSVKWKNDGPYCIVGTN